MASGRLADMIREAGGDPDQINVTPEDLVTIRTVESVGNVYDNLPLERAAALKEDLAEQRKQHDEAMRRIGRGVLRR